VGLGAPLGTGAPAASSAAEPKETEETGIQASSEEADPVDGPEDEAEDDAEDEEEEDD
jgi:hypothetical protein